MRIDLCVRQILRESEGYQWKNKILIVDDNKLNRQSLADIFRKAYQIVESEDGKKALEYLKRIKDFR